MEQPGPPTNFRRRRHSALELVVFGFLWQFVPVWWSVLLVRNEGQLYVVMAILLGVVPLLAGTFHRSFRVGLAAFCYGAAAMFLYAFVVAVIMEVNEPRRHALPPERLPSDHVRGQLASERQLMPTILASIDA